MLYNLHIIYLLLEYIKLLHILSSSFSVAIKTASKPNLKFVNFIEYFEIVMCL